MKSRFALSAVLLLPASVVLALPVLAASLTGSGGQGSQGQPARPTHKPRPTATPRTTPTPEPSVAVVGRGARSRITLGVVDHATF
jgi:hypothetical protein